MQKIKAEYIWIDGSKPVAKLRSKTKILDHVVSQVSDIPEWGFDGSSTQQAEGHSSDCVLKPVYFVADVVRGNPHILVMCEVFEANGNVHKSNHRARLREIARKYENHEAWFGIEQEYTFFKGSRPLGWPDNGFPAPQGGYYCGVGSDEVFGRQIVEEHMSVCLEAGISISGINAEVMPGQWEFQVGPLGPLAVADQLWLSRWLLYRVAENYGVSATLDPKPVKGDWNGAGAHTNFSTKTMRDPGGIKAIEQACMNLRQNHKKHIEVYGYGNHNRLTGLHETCSIDEFRYGVSDRGASIRIPLATSKEGCGYLEDRRPAANMDPYQVCAVLMETILNNDIVSDSSRVGF
ncbi:MAG: glutamine synthetase [Candidatus Magasanikbacteria bacterium RIFCSPHIGHO2_01_FULL_33_34]|uniref:Glutamine synthetase n=1 Tax=Candidatus Magasanikbacteria bacterium RIFCSPHIGHO2_01_FULL_33_34 TaxID=1798671 RepID=A0A1F6LH55_9BACT|nr:MAG: glutamine synthetase [Candidatus Magasanikbacteria bacterium RIFCSPHIGHO2_01_FULL_33_34]OGH66084.1 MAG: glutamine synthetase [Candidatus Magasanikbacteria bacterium RIFCSPHIGHO2_02_FULL_33_17]OGH75930.1 MAG: glutamine synthetase [Candidatus Magasanikbacteria bacterium RIFCSPLOWO2_01_FULL_33_34]OGH81584.1 MAG: glutamine synthetase [Candidatus Magasanikbacteria bacterium RIFCSPLOWO2_12_FULL_34_7]